MKIGEKLKKSTYDYYGVLKKTIKRHKANFFNKKKHLKNLFIFISQSSKQIPL